MRIGIPRETLKGENRVAATPKTIPQLIKLGYDVSVEKGAGIRADFPDAAYVQAGASIGDEATVWGADLVLTVNEPTHAQLALMRRGATLVSFLAPRQNPDVVATMAKAGITALSMDMVPRISRAQSMDALSSMANISGYRAVVEALHAFGRFFGGQVTAAGKVPPANVFVIGTGVAGLAAIGAANSLGAVVRATDVRPETAEQVESMGASFVFVDAGETAQGVSSDGYAKETSDDFNKRAAIMYAEQAKLADIIITTAAIPGKPSPRLITADMVATMTPGSVIVDLAATGGGNCELTKPGLSYMTDGGVTIIGYTDLASRLPGQSSQLYGTNLVNLLKLMTPEKDGQLVIDFEDEVVRTSTICRDGEATFPPPPVKVSAAPAAAKPAPAPVKAEPKAPADWRKMFGIVAVAAVVLIVLLTFAPASFLNLMGVFVLAVVVGYYVVWNVNHALHTPLMSETNAISGIILVGAMLQLVGLHLESTPLSWAVRIIAFAATLIASINIFGGFTVTNRMLSMFKRG
ncbi:MAG: Re/Si-specific NAD(P)(+) transhydrogenase subunit alpha [Propionibacteriaceae bacterium]|nr:Re/Si-specific NAD(P)(+) transhydrogenase subunit alpha [Propionibacteriaceae bacterium]